jgi:hypothetical protein
MAADELASSEGPARVFAQAINGVILPVDVCDYYFGTVEDDRG